MSAISATTSLLAHSLAWALLHSLWQGLLLYVASYVLFKALPNLGARIKYYLSFSVFTALFIWFADTWLSQYQQLKNVAVYTTIHVINYTIPITNTIKTVPINAPAPSLLHYALTTLNQCIPIIIALYLAGLTFMLARFLMNIVQLKALRTQGLTQPGAHLLSLVENWQTKLAITRSIQLFISDRINVPMMLGTLKPVILLPIATINNLSTEQVEAILLHELAHIRRHDYLLNIFQTIVETILFFNPFVWLMSRIIRREREECCDELVVANTTNPLPYAAALAILEHNRINPNQLSLAATGHKNQLLNRIKRIMTMKNKNPGYGQPAIIVAVIMAISLSIAVITITPSLAQKAKGKKGEQTKKNSAQPIISAVNATLDNNADTLPKGESKSSSAHNDSALVRFALKNGTRVCAWLSANPLDGDGIIKELTYANIGEAINWKELKLDLQQHIAGAYKHINDPRLAGEISNEIDKEIEKHKKFREQFVSIIDSVYVTFKLNDGSEYYVNLACDPFTNPKIIKGIHSVSMGHQTDWDELRSKFDQAITETYKKIMSPELKKAIATTIDEEIEFMKNSIQKVKKRDDDDKSLLANLFKDGLIDTAATYTVHYCNDTLIINNVLQSQNIVDKYSKYFNKNSSVTMSGTPDKH